MVSRGEAGVVNRERYRDRQTDRQTETDSQTDRQTETDRQRQRDIERMTNRQINGPLEKHRDLCSLSYYHRLGTS